MSKRDRNNKILSALSAKHEQNSARLKHSSTIWRRGEMSSSPFGLKAQPHCADKAQGRLQNLVTCACSWARGIPHKQKVSATARSCPSWNKNTKEFQAFRQSPIYLHAGIFETLVRIEKTDTSRCLSMPQQQNLSLPRSLNFHRFLPR